MAGNPRNAWVIGIGVCAGLIYLFGIFAYESSLSDASADIKAIHQMGVPTTYEELLALSPTEGSDASADYAKCIQMASAFKGSQKDAYMDLGRRHAVFDTLSDAKLIPNIFPPLMAGASKDRWNWGTDEERIRPNRRFVWHAIRMLVNIAIANCDKGNVDKAIDQMKAARRIANQAQANPECTMVIAPLYPGYIGMLKSRPQDPSVERFVAQETRLIAMPSVRFQIYDYEIEDVTDSHNPFVDESSEKNWLKRQWETFKDRRQNRQAATYELRIWRDALPRLPRDDRDWKGAARSLFDTNKRWSSPGTERTGDVYSCAYTLIGFGYFVARQHVLASAAKLLLVHQQTGTFPTQLDPKDADSIDPFTRQPLIYRRKANGFLLYSVGRNLVDDGGVEFSPTSSQDDYSFDITLR